MQCNATVRCIAARCDRRRLPDCRERTGQTLEIRAEFLPAGVLRPRGARPFRVEPSLLFSATFFSSKIKKRVSDFGGTYFYICVPGTKKVR